MWIQSRDAANVARGHRRRAARRCARARRPGGCGRSCDVCRPGRARRRSRKRRAAATRARPPPSGRVRGGSASAACASPGPPSVHHISRYHEECMHSSATREPLDPRITLLKQLADPLRLRVVDVLGNRGPSSVSELAAHMDVPLPQLSNHLRQLREAGLVRVERSGRSAIYELADPGLERLLPMLDSITGRVAPKRKPAVDDFSQARTCYHHLAGYAGVALYAALRKRDAVVGASDGTVELGPNARAVLGSLGVDADAIEPGRRRFAFECLDVTQHEPHLAGALGDAITGSLLAKRWIEPSGGDGRAVRVTRSGKAGLRRTLGITLEPAA